MFDQDFAVLLIIISLLALLVSVIIVGMFSSVSKVPSDEDVSNRTSTRKN